MNKIKLKSDSSGEDSNSVKIDIITNNETVIEMEIGRNYVGDRRDFIIGVLLFAVLMLSLLLIKIIISL